MKYNLKDLYRIQYITIEKLYYESGVFQMLLSVFLKPLKKQRYDNLRYLMINEFGFNNTLIVLFMPNLLIQWSKENIL